LYVGILQKMATVDKVDQVDSESVDSAVVIPDSATQEEAEYREKLQTANAEWSIKIQQIIDYYSSDPSNRQWPSSLKRVKDSFRQKLRTFSYDLDTGVLYKSVKNSDGIGE
jgi:hypothetical protein